MINFIVFFIRGPHPLHGSVPGLTKMSGMCQPHIPYPENVANPRPFLGFHLLSCISCEIFSDFKL